MSTGVTLRENNLKELEGGRIMDSQGVLVGNRAALLARPGLLAIVHELIERFEAHLTAGAPNCCRPHDDAHRQNAALVQQSVACSSLMHPTKLKARFDQYPPKIGTGPPT